MNIQASYGHAASNSAGIRTEEVGDDNLMDRQMLAAKNNLLQSHSVDFDEEKRSAKAKLIEPSSLKDKMEPKKKQPRAKRWTKPEGKPSRPLSAYNLFFRHQRLIMLGPDAPSAAMDRYKKRVHCKTHGKIGFAELAKEIGARWKMLDAETKKVYERQAQREKKIYDAKVQVWKHSRNDQGEIQNCGRIDLPLPACLPEDSERIMSGAAMQNRRLSTTLLPQKQTPDTTVSLEYLRCLEEQRLLDQKTSLLRAMMESSSMGEVKAPTDYPFQGHPRFSYNPMWTAAHDLHLVRQELLTKNMYLGVRGTSDVMQRHSGPTMFL